MDVHRGDAGHIDEVFVLGETHGQEGIPGKLSENPYLAQKRTAYSMSNQAIVLPNQRNGQNPRLWNCSRIEKSPHCQQMREKAWYLRETLTSNAVVLYNPLPEGCPGSRAKSLRIHQEVN
jgi:hypothetical protein